MRFEKTINTADSKKAARQLMELIRPFPPFSKLRDQEVDVLAHMIYEYNVGWSKGFSDDDIWTILMSKKGKEAIREEILGKDGNPISMASLQTILSSLRKKGILEDGRVKEEFTFKLEDSNSFSVVVNIVEG